MVAQSFPVAKKGSKEDVEAIQESVEFCRLVFEMIDPKIKLPKIRTAINNALSIRKALIPSPTDQNPWAHWRNPMDMMRQG
jgi:hypothetical protein